MMSKWQKNYQFKGSLAKGLMLIGLLGLSSASRGASLAFTNLSEGDANQAIDEFSANFTHTSVSGASPLGSLLGVELGLVGGITKSPKIESLARSADPSVDANPIPHGGILGMVSVPLGFTFEASLIPKTGKDSFQFRNLGLAVKWSLTSAVLDLPVSLALKLHHMSSKLHFTQDVSGVTANVDFADKVSGLMVLVSKNFGIVEPYAGLGVVKAKGDFSIDGTTSFFSSGVQSYKAERKGAQFVLGTEVSLLMLKLGAEYARQFGAHSLTAKLAFSF